MDAIGNVVKAGPPHHVQGALTGRCQAERHSRRGLEGVNRIQYDFHVIHMNLKGSSYEFQYEL